MSFKIKRLIVENVVVFEDRFTIDFSSTTLNHIEARYKQDAKQSNGAGKSVLIDCISLALFGKGLRFPYIQDYISSTKPDGGIYIGLELENKSNDVLKIERWRRAGSESNKAKLWWNDVCLSKDATVQKIDEMLQSYIGITHSNFLSCIFSVMLPGFMVLRPSQRFEVLENALAIKRMDSIIKKINASLKATDDSLSAVSESLLDKSILLGQETAKRDLYLSNTKELETSIKNQREEYRKFSEKEQEILVKRQDYWTLLEDSRGRLSTKEAARLALKTKASSIFDIKTKATGRLSTISKALKQKEGSAVECIVCKSVISKDSERGIKEHYSKEISELDLELEQVNAEIKGLTKEITKLASVEAKVTDMIASLDSDLRFIQSSMLAAEKIIANTTASLVESSKTYESSKLATLERETKELSDRKLLLSKDLKMIAAWKSAMSKNGLRLAYIKEEVGTLSAIASKYASAVYNSPTQVKFFISEERDVPNLDFTVNGKNASAFSTGEKRLLEIAITLSLMTLLKSAGLNLEFIILDECMDGLAITSKQNVLSLIDSLAECNQIITISHDIDMQQKAGNIILVTKDSTTGLSTLSSYMRT